MGVSENRIVYPKKPNGFADHYPYGKMAISLGILTQHFHTQQVMIFVYGRWGPASMLGPGGRSGRVVLNHGVEELAALAELRSNEDAPGAKMINCEL